MDQRTENNTIGNTRSKKIWDHLLENLDPKDVYGPDFPGKTSRILKEKGGKQDGKYRTRRLHITLNRDWKNEYFHLYPFAIITMSMKL
jgi:hypothetical protein